MKSHAHAFASLDAALERAQPNQRKGVPEKDFPYLGET
jgi:hypothetical protein